MNYDTESAYLRGSYRANHKLDLGFADCTVQIVSNSCVLLDSLREYFSAYLQAKDKDKTTITLELYEGNELVSPASLSEWPRPSEKAPKEAFLDLFDARLIQKVRTGLLFLQGVGRGIATGPLHANLNQVINFINNQTISLWKREGWEICHAAALSGQSGVIAFAGFSGGGKSTLMLHLMNEGPYIFISNDRLLLKNIDGRVAARGIAKMPRVNPGTLLNNNTLIHVLPEQRRTALARLSTGELWELEEKYDVPMSDIFGQNRIAEEGDLRAVVILDWDRQADADTQLERISLNRNSRELEALMKTPGPFHADSIGHFTSGLEQPSPDDYLETLGDTPVYCLRGGVDFSAAAALCSSLVDGVTDSGDR